MLIVGVFLSGGDSVDAPRTSTNKFERRGTAMPFDDDRVRFRRANAQKPLENLSGEVSAVCTYAT
jgi:hypothetical protein